MFGGLLPLLVVGLIIYAVVRHRDGGGSSSPPPSVADDVEEALGRWVDAGLLDSDRAELIRAFEVTQSSLSVVDTVRSSERRVPLVAEALGYLGGVLGIVGLVMLISRYWGDMSDVVRLMVSVSGMVLGIVAGAVVPAAEDSALTRLRWFVWMVATAAAGVVGGVVVHDLMGRDDWRQETQVALGVAIAVAVVSACLWWWRERPIQQVTMIAGAGVAVGCAVAQVSGTGPTGAAVWGFGLLVIAVGAATRAPSVVVSVTAGAAIVIIGAAMAADEWMGPGSLLMVISAAGCVVAGSVWATRSGSLDAHMTVVDRLRRSGPTGLVIVGSLGLVQAVPLSAVHFADRAAVSTGAVLWAAGALLLILVDQLTIRYPVLVGVIGGLGLVIGPAVTAGRSEAVATISGLATALVMVGLGTVPGRVLLSLIGSVSLLIYVPWSISHFFPGEDRAPLLIAASGGVIVIVAVMLSRSAGRVRTELAGRHPR